MLGEDGSYFGKGDLFFPLRNYLPDRAVAKRTFLFYQRRRGQFMDELTLVKWGSGWQLRLVDLSIGKISLSYTRRPGYEVPERPGKGLAGRSWAGWCLALIPSGYPGTSGQAGF